MVPKLEDLREQRAAILFQGQRTYEEWAAMTPWQRDDFIRRFIKYSEEQKKLTEEEMARNESKLRRH